MLGRSSVDDLPSGRKHPITYLAVLGHLVARAPVAMHIVGRLLDVRVWCVFLNTAHSLTPSAEESFHAIEIDNPLHPLRALLRFLLNGLILAIATTYIVIAKPVCLRVLALWRLNLRFECVIDTLPLR